MSSFLPSVVESNLSVAQRGLFGGPHERGLEPYSRLKSGSRVGPHPTEGRGGGVPTTKGPEKSQETYVDAEGGVLEVCAD